ncbi:hypothetical protein B0T22DRAFT_89723 [Podospora appendiculata]|uniref:F-box domain-containing protein n=1 Tax=Podospora appendiculata TaxID=314037 RepID=A0AAE0XK63_9PEZI|nr:hypothetical protein B0T22DRAFT_89723 [Podospora appendiculata]
MRDITDLPRDLFILIVLHLPPLTLVRCRSVSRQWHAAFTSDDISLLLLRWNFPRCREMRLAVAAAAARDASSSSPSPSSSSPGSSPHQTGLPNNLNVELECIALERPDWSSTFAAVARRYHLLRHAKPHAIEKLELARFDPDGEQPSLFSFRGVAPWNRFLRVDEKTANFHYPDPTWWYSQQDGVLVYPAEIRAGLRDDQSEGYVYQLLDLSTGIQVDVPFDVRQKHIRRVRLAESVLIFEWAEALPYHQLNDREVVHRHFVTAFDIVRKASASVPSLEAGSRCPWTWKVEFRSEWKLHFLGLPLNRSDRFFSAHTATHYAVYFWQPNRSLYQDDPIEQLAVWDISSPSPYRPSEDPNGDRRPPISRTPSPRTGLWHGTNGPSNETVTLSTDATTESTSDSKSSLATATAGPQVIRRMAWRELDFYGLRQRATPQLRNLALDGQNLYVIEEEHKWADGQHSSLNPPRVHLVRCTGIPIIPSPASPASEQDLLDPDDKPKTLSNIIDGPVFGPAWVDVCGADGGINMNFCRRVVAPDESGNNTGWPIWTDIGSISLSRTQWLRELLDKRSSFPWAWTMASAISTDDDPGAFAGLAGSSRCPGWAPCWRHEDFPYLTVTEMVDFAAGVRVTARHCFLLETLSVHIRPAISVKGAGIPPLEDCDSDDHSLESHDLGTGSAGRCDEAQFSDSTWSQLLGKGHIDGDERWIVGEDDKGRVTILRF